MKRILLLAIVLVPSPLAFVMVSIFTDFPSFGPTNGRRINDRGFIQVMRKASPDNRFVLLSYKYDTGALGYSRVWWAVIPASHENTDLSEYELPDSYEGIGWSDSNELLVHKWHPYYSLQGDTLLTTGEVVHGVVVRVIEDSAVTK